MQLGKAVAPLEAGVLLSRAQNRDVGSGCSQSVIWGPSAMIMCALGVAKLAAGDIPRIALGIPSAVTTTQVACGG